MKTLEIKPSWTEINTEFVTHNDKGEKKTEELNLYLDG